MPIRNGWRVGDYLVLDDESGAVHYASEMVKIWDGTMRHRSMFETRQPQEFVRARNDPKVLRDVRTAPAAASVPSTFSLFVGDISAVPNPVQRPTGPASHLYTYTDDSPGIGSMIVGTNFTVR